MPARDWRWLSSLPSALFQDGREDLSKVATVACSSLTILWLFCAPTQVQNSSYDDQVHEKQSGKGQLHKTDDDLQK